MNSGKATAQYEGTVVAVGNSRGMRLPAGFFKAHPEFDGKVDVTVVAEGAILVSARPVARRAARTDQTDPVLASFLQYMSDQMSANPQDIVVADAEQLRRVARLVEGVRTD